MNIDASSLMNKQYPFWASPACFRYLMQYLYTGVIPGAPPPPPQWPGARGALPLVVPHACRRDATCHGRVLYP